MNAGERWRVAIHRAEAAKRPPGGAMRRRYRARPRQRPRAGNRGGAEWRRTPIGARARSARAHGGNTRVPQRGTLC